MPKHIVIAGGGVAGLAAAYELTRLQEQGADLTFELFEVGQRLGGILQTERLSTQEGEFIVELGPDGWVSEKPWARELAVELGLENQLLPSNDAERVTMLWENGALQQMPPGMRMMVPTDLAAIEDSSLFSSEAKQAYRSEPQRAEELKRTAPARDESVASFVRRHFGDDVLRTIGAPLLGGIFGGDVEALSVQAVMKAFVDMEREHGSLIVALQAKSSARGTGGARGSIFTSLKAGTGALAEAMAARVDSSNVSFGSSVAGIAREGDGWRVEVSRAGDVRSSVRADVLLLALPVTQAASLLSVVDPACAELLAMQTSTAAVVAFGFRPDQGVTLPRGFGFLVPPRRASGGDLLAATFCHQKYDHRAPAGCQLVRAYYGGLDVDDEGVNLPHGSFRALPFQNALMDLRVILGDLPKPAFEITRGWPRALPQYGVGHLERMAQLEQRVQHLGGLYLLGNGYRGVGLPDLIRDARAAARAVAG